MNMKFKRIEKELTEDFQTSPHGHHGINSALNIGIALATRTGYAYGFDKKRKTIFEEMRKVFREWHEVTGKKFSFYSSIGLFEKEQPVGYRMTTLVSVEGESKQTRSLSSKDFANWHLFTLLFDEDALVNSNGRVFFKDNKQALSDVNQWKSILENLKHGPMHYVLDNYYSKSDFQRIENASPSELGHYISELEDFGKDRVRTITEDENLPLLAKGLTGFSKAIKRRREMRVAFWLSWAKSRRDLKMYAKEFNHPEIRNWEWKYA